MVFTTIFLCIAALPSADFGSEGGLVLNRDLTALGSACKLEAFRAVLAKPEAVWFVGRVDQARGSPKSLGKGVGPAEDEYFGPCHVDATLTGPKAVGIATFSVKEIVPQEISGPGLHYDPRDQAGGAIVATVEWVIDGRAVLGNVVVIPDEWRGDVVEALDRLRREPALADERPVRADLDLRSLLKDKNSFIALAAFRKLAAAGASPETLAEAFSVADPIRHAAYTQILLNCATANANPYMELLKGQVAAAADTKALRPMALAVREVFGVSGSWTSRPAALELGRLIRDRGDTLGAKRDPYFECLVLPEDLLKLATKPAN